MTLSGAKNRAPDTQVVIREFTPGDEVHFRRLNEEWIIRHFSSLEPMDQRLLADPRRTILAGGGRIFLAVRQGETVGCCALLAIGYGEFELVKMAVTESAQGEGIGRRLLDRAISEARDSGARRLCLETNRKLQPAIRLYESVGFRHVPAEQFAPSPYTRRDVCMEMSLDQPGSAPRRRDAE
jgi:GNAT superfamily N-acetyltransferase